MYVFHSENPTCQQITKKSYQYWCEIKWSRLDQYLIIVLRCFGNMKCKLAVIEITFSSYIWNNVYSAFCTSLYHRHTPLHTYKGFECVSNSISWWMNFAIGQPWFACKTVKTVEKIMRPRGICLKKALLATEWSSLYLNQWENLAIIIVMGWAKFFAPPHFI